MYAPGDSNASAVVTTSTRSYLRDMGDRVGDYGMTILLSVAIGIVVLGIGAGIIYVLSEHLDILIGVVVIGLLASVSYFVGKTILDGFLQLF